MTEQQDATITFRATIERNGKTATGIVVPPEVVAALGTSRKPAVWVTIKGHMYRSSVASRGERFLLGVSAEQRAGAGVAAGDVVDVALALDTEPREVTVPPDLAAALAADDTARGAFEALSYSNKRRHVLAIEGAKTDETRERRIAKAVATLGTT